MPGSKPWESSYDYWVSKSWSETMPETVAELVNL